MHLIRARLSIPPPKDCPKKKKRKKVQPGLRHQELGIDDPKWDEWERGLKQVRLNIDCALVEMQNELKRMAGRIITTDHPPHISHDSKTYTDEPKISSSSSCCSSSSSLDE